MTRYHFINGTKVAFTAEEEAARDAEEARFAAEVAATAYQSNRRENYPAIEEQLDLIYHSGIDAWKAKIKETKDKYPKP
tara:strand:- start:116 stop:352 length:237 start_codon:yes stop_codon:yes gene_type:complete